MSPTRLAGSAHLRTALLLTFGLRGLYLLRFGWDPMWANAVYLAQAKSLVVGPPRLYGPPVAVWVLVGERALGLAPVPALALLALAAHLALAAGTIALAHAMWPSLPRFKGQALALFIAATPLVAGYSGYEDIGALLGAALFVCAVAAAVFNAASPSIRWSAIALAAALVAAATRTEAVVGGAALALVLAIVEPERGLPAGRSTAMLVATGVALGLCVTAAAHRVAVGRFELADPTYPFYTFYAGMPPRMCDTPCDTEYGSYAASITHFGSFAENRGSLVRAVLLHPRALVTRTVYKVFEWAGRVADPGTVGWLAPLAVIGLIRTVRDPRRRGFALLAFLGPALVLLVPPAVPMYFLSVLPAFLLLAADGAEAVGAPASTRLGLAIGIVLFGIAWAGHYGWPGPSSPRVLNTVARDLERRCQAGCLMNYLPQHVSAEAWVVLDAGAPLPPPPSTDERFALGEVSPELAVACRYRERVARARAAGYRGPVLYLEVRAETASAYIWGFDRERDFEGPVDLSHAHLEAVYADGPDVARLWSFPPGTTP